jgi:hypothetical protein
MTDDRLRAHLELLRHEAREAMRFVSGMDKTLFWRTASPNTR